MKTTPDAVIIPASRPVLVEPELGVSIDCIGTPRACHHNVGLLVLREMRLKIIQNNMYLKILLEILLFSINPWYHKV